MIGAAILALAGEAVHAVAFDVTAGVGVFVQAAGLTTEELEPRVRMAHGGGDVLGWRRRGGLRCPAVRVGARGGGGCCAWTGPL